MQRFCAVSVENVCLFRLLPTVLPHHLTELDRGFVVVVLTWLEYRERDEPQRKTKSKSVGPTCEVLILCLSVSPFHSVCLCGLVTR